MVQKINPIYPSYTSTGSNKAPVQPKFGALDYYNAGTIGGGRFCTITQLFRYPQQFKRLPEFLKEHFPDGVTIYDYACSDGSEPYSIAMILDQAGMPAEKYPIIARDISPLMIAMAKSGYLMERNDIRQTVWDNHKIDLRKDLRPVSSARQKKISLREPRWTERLPVMLSRLPFITSWTQPDHWWDSFSGQVLSEAETLFRNPQAQLENFATYAVSDRLRSRIQFEVGDLSKDAFPQEKPALILFNAAMSHLNLEQQRQLLQGAFNHIPPGTFIWISDGEIISPQMLLDIGFEAETIFYDTQGDQSMLSLKKP